jgi:uncharacterized protein YqjF (DUF2071 family)
MTPALAGAGAAYNGGMSFSFLTARWTNLFLATYAVPPELLTPRLAPGLELDLRDGQSFVSLVAFQFLDTRVLGVPWPGYRNFAELNLRFYVRCGPERGVMFVREFVPQRLVAGLARLIYNEPYQAAPLTMHIDDKPDTLQATYRLRLAGQTHIISASGDKPAYRPDEASAEHFFKEHRWGFGISRRGRALRYEVVHPVWDVYRVRSYQVDLDWARVYGPEWGCLQGAEPYSTVLAVGSPVRVYPWGKLRSAQG